MTLARAGSRAGVATRQFSAIEHRFQDAGRFGGELAQPDFLLGSEQDARAQAVRLHKAVHENDLIEADHEEEPGEFRECVFA